MRKDIDNELLRYEEVNLLNKSELARRLGCSRQTITTKIEKLNNNTAKSKRIYESKLDEFKDLIATKVEKYSCTSMAIYLLLKDKYGYKGSYSMVSKYVSKFKETEKVKVTIRFETVPGYQSQVDWKESLKMIDIYGVEHEINIFLIILGYSRKKFVKLTFDKKQETLFECMTSAFEFFKGITDEILFDNMKTVVDRAKSDFSNVVINDTFAAFAKDAGFLVRTCRAFRPETKGKIEIVAKIMNRLKAYNNEFKTTNELFDIVDKMNIELNNEIVQGIGQTPNQRYLKEQSTLTNVNIDILKKYFIKQKEYKVSKESMITYKAKKYSVPTIYVNKYVTLVEGDSHIYIYYNTNLITSYNITLDYFLNYKEDHYKDILSKSVYKDKTSKQIDEIVKENLKKLDNILIQGDE